MKKKLVVIILTGMLAGSVAFAKTDPSKPEMKIEKKLGEQDISIHCLQKKANNLFAKIERIDKNKITASKMEKIEKEKNYLSRLVEAVPTFESGYADTQRIKLIKLLPQEMQKQLGWKTKVLMYLPLDLLEIKINIFIPKKEKKNFLEKQKAKYKKKFKKRFIDSVGSLEKILEDKTSDR